MSCPYCGCEEIAIMGSFGNRMFGCCTDCGMQMSWEAEEDSEFDDFGDYNIKPGYRKVAKGTIVLKNRSKNHEKRSKWQGDARLTEVYDTACALYDGGWRAYDPDNDFREQWPDMGDEEIAELKEALQEVDRRAHAVEEWYDE